MVAVVLSVDEFDGGSCVECRRSIWWWQCWMLRDLMIVAVLGIEGFHDGCGVEWQWIDDD